jgi:hypothetical protein
MLQCPVHVLLLNHKSCKIESDLMPHAINVIGNASGV